MRYPPGSLALRKAGASSSATPDAGRSEARANAAATLGTVREREPVLPGLRPA